MDGRKIPAETGPSRNRFSHHALEDARRHVGLLLAYRSRDALGGKVKARNRIALGGKVTQGPAVEMLKDASSRKRSEGGKGSVNLKDWTSWVS